MAEQRLDLGDVRAALPQPGGETVPQPVRSQPLDAGPAADRKHHLGDARARQRAALAQPQRTGMVAALVYVNTLMIQDLLAEPEWADALTAETSEG